MDALETIMKRRSVRKFRSEPVPREVLEKIVQAGIEAPSGCNMQLRQYVIIDDPKRMDEIRFCSNAIGGAPAAIVILVEPKASPYGEFWMQDASAAMQNMLLAAVALGYGACWIEGAMRRAEDRLRQILGVPESLRVWSLLPVGKPDQEPKRPAKS
jgi:nitroreductase